jgi:uncharacterized membrane protein YgcG
MTRDAAAQAVHERLEHAVSEMPAFDVEAGWASLAAQLESPVAPVIPLRRRRPSRVLTLAVAAAMFVGGSALAMVRHGAAPELALGPPASATPSWSGLVTGPHAHPAFTGAPSVTDPTPPETHGPTAPDGGTQRVASPTPTSTGDGTSDGGSGYHKGPTHVDAPDDTDHGTGNDGQHDDNGKGNDAQGQDQGGNGGGNQSSGGGQGSSDRATDPSPGSNGSGNANAHGNGP